MHTLCHLHIHNNVATCTTYICCLLYAVQQPSVLLCILNHIPVVRVYNDFFLISVRLISGFNINIYRYFKGFCYVNYFVGWRKRNQQDATNLMFITKFLSQHVSGIIRRTGVCTAAYGVLHCNKRGTKP